MHDTAFDGRKGTLSRRDWLGTVPAAVLLAGFPATTSGSDDNASQLPELHPGFPSQDPATVREVVGASHANIDRVRELVEASPALAKSAWDWGFGDWETALGAASHMGRRDIAQLLIKHGARPDLFTFAMMGHLEIVKAYVAAVPGIQRIPGPHGITLLQHARKGGEQSLEVTAFLESLGDADMKPVSLSVSDDQKRLYMGRYHFGEGQNDSFVVLTNRRGQLAIKRGDDSSRNLNRVEVHGFAPSGAPNVRVRFNVKDGQAVSLTIHDSVPLLTASRIA